MLISSLRAKVLTDAMKWQEMNGNGQTVFMMILKTHMSCGAVRGSFFQLTAAAPAAAGTFREAGTSMSDFVAPGLKLWTFTLLPFVFPPKAGENFFGTIPNRTKQNTT